MVKSPKGSVVVYVADGRLRLRWSGRDAQGRMKRFSFAFGAVNATNRVAAERLARSIDLDIASGNFDASLRKYKQDLEKDGSLTLEDLVDRFVRNHLEPTQSSSLERYRTLKNHLLRCFGNVMVDSLGEEQGREFIEYLHQLQLKGETINLYLTLLRAVWEWGMKKGLVQVCPWLDLSVKAEPNPPPKPFTREEVRAILTGFEGDYYGDFVRFVLGTGCRIGEAIALSWDALNEDCSEVWFGRSYDAKGKRVKATKTNKTRTVPVSPGIQELLQQRRSKAINELVFPTPKGGYIDRHNFLNRHWKPVLERLEIPYRPPYNSRHTRWSQEITEGMDIATAAL